MGEGFTHTIIDYIKGVVLNLLCLYIFIHTHACTDIFKKGKMKRILD